ncbi:chromosome partitioning protein [Saccharopolyspora dendranthemae]|uniref:Chromosome partitioning protein n=1 Tax=Saccharopolyspora dendranthemae TaxID=1181886 RepID=A0A561V8D3_9PSEU|nr:chromosome partitioning protein [Saccharopolyspora dendranthemae]
MALGALVRVVAVMNYKGGVGKTTLTANLGAVAASRGLRVLLIDLDPQTNLTFSFFSIDEWHDRIKDSHTIKQWYEGDMPGREVSLADLVVTPEAVNEQLGSATGRLDLISSHLGLIDVDLKLAALLGGTTTLASSQQRFLELHDCLRRELADERLSDYDLVLFDCAPNFGLVTKTAIVASERILVPAKADYLSTLGLTYLEGNCRKLVREFNDFAGYGGKGEHGPINPEFLGVVFTMVQIYSQRVTAAHQNYIDEAQVNSGVPVLESTIRNSTRHFAGEPEKAVPPMLSAPGSDEVVQEFERLTDEVLDSLSLTGEVSG